MCGLFKQKKIVRLYLRETIGFYFIQSARCLERLGDLLFGLHYLAPSANVISTEIIETSNL